MSKTILITAATGVTGRAAIAHLAKSGHKIRALAHRKDERSAALQALGAEIVFGDIKDFNVVDTALKDVDYAYFCYPITKGLVQAAAQFGQAAKDNGVRAIVNMSQKIARRDAASHASFEHWLSERVLDGTGIATTHLRPPFFAEWMLMLAPMIRQGQVYAPFEDGRTAFITGEDQGRAIAGILEEPGPHGGKTYYLTGPEELSFQQVIEKTAQVLGKSISYQVVPFSAMQENITATSIRTGQNNMLTGYAESNQPDGTGEPHIFQHLQAAYQDFEKGLFEGVSSDVENITGVAPMKIEHFIDQHRSVFL